MRRLWKNEIRWFLAGKLSEPSLTEGSGIFGDVAMAVGDLAITKGIPYLAKKGVEAGRYYASEAMRDPKLQKKAINYTLNKARPVIQKVGSEMFDQLSTKVHQTNVTKLTDLIWMELGLIYMQQLGNFRNQKKVGRYRGIILQGHTILLKSRLNSIQKRVKFLKYINNPQVLQMRLQCNMMLIMMFVPTVKKIW